MDKNKGYVTFILHAHLPFIHHPESEDYLEEQWLFEAISETYIPLLLNFKKLEEENVKFRLTMTMTPPLLYMLDNKLLQERYIKYLKKHIELAKKRTFYSKARRHGRTVCTSQIMYQEADSCKLLHSREKHIEYIART